MAEMGLGVGSPDRPHYVIWDRNGKVIRNFHTNDADFAQREISRLRESFELLGGITVEINPEAN